MLKLKPVLEWLGKALPPANFQIKAIIFASKRINYQQVCTFDHHLKTFQVPSMRSPQAPILAKTDRNVQKGFGLMVLKLHSLLLSILMFTTVSVGYADTASAYLTCTSLLKSQPGPKAIGYYINGVTRRSLVEPRFLDPVQEAEMAKKWQGSKEGPILLTQTLSDKTAFIDQQLLAADAGTVKSATASGFLSMRLRHEWNGKDMSTNLGLSSDAIVSKTLEGSSKLVPETAKAVFVFMHGWGTKTTGHHVAAAFSNFLAPYGIVVLSIDAPHHAYGPRVAELAPKEYATYLRDFRNEFIPEGVPTFIGGHSGGGFIADMMMRYSDDAELGIGAAFDGAINLSGPMDGAPGKSLAEKNAAEELINRNPEIMNLVPEAERDLSVLLLTQGKTSATSGLSAETFMSSVNWIKPKHNGADYIPTLVVMGERDGLYVGREKVFEEHLAALDNTETHVMGLRPDFKGAENWVSHMIFDHYRPGTKDPETFNVVKDFIEKQIGKKLEKSKGSALAEGADISKVGIVLNVVQEYYNNLAFRKFATDFVYTIKSASPEAQKMGERAGRVTKLLKRSQKELVREEKVSRGGPRIETLKNRISYLLSEAEKSKAMITSKFIPEGELKAFAEQNIAERAVLETENSSMIKDKQNSAKELRAVRAEVQRDKKAFDALVEKLLWEESLKDADVMAVQKDIDLKLQTMIDLQVKMNELNSDLVTANTKKGIFAVNPGPKEIAVYTELDAAFSDYNKAMAKGRQIVGKAIGEGVAGVADLTLFDKLYGSVKAYTNHSPTPESLLGREDALSTKTKELDGKIERGMRAKDQLLKAYIEKVTPGLYTFSETRLYNELNKPMEDIIKSSSRIEPLWRIWTEIWKERPPEQGTSLY